MTPGSGTGGKVLKVDPTNDTTSLVGSVFAGITWTGGVLAPNGKIYFSPTSGTSAQILQLDPTNDTTSLIGSDALIPSNLANLATSNYNMYYNKF